MNMYLPVSGFKWVENSILNSIDWRTLRTDSEYGYIIEVDLEYPIELHDIHSDFPLAPLKMKIPNNLLSEYQKNTLEYLKKFGYRRTATEKLMLTLNDKEKYIVHFKLLKLYLKLGLKITQIHRGIIFKQSRIFKDYIELNTELRQNATSDFEKDLYKLMNNSLFGKTIQDNRKHLTISLALNMDQGLKLIRKPNFEQFHILSEDKVLFKMKKASVKLNKPIAIGFTVLEHSKHHMYNLHYNVFKKYYKNDIKLVYTDTDSFLYEIKTDQYFEELKNIFSSIMDFSNFDKKHELFDEKNKKVIGYLKSEYGEKVVNEFIGIKSKLYSIKYEETSNKKTAKGLQRAVLKKFIDHEHYKNVIENNNIYNTSMKRIQSKMHKIETVQLEKMIFMPFDDKRYILPDGINTLPFGHKDIEHS